MSDDALDELLRALRSNVMPETRRVDFRREDENDSGMADVDTRERARDLLNIMRAMEAEAEAASNDKKETGDSKQAASSDTKDILKRAASSDAKETGDSKRAASSDTKDILKQAASSDTKEASDTQAASSDTKDILKQ